MSMKIKYELKYKNRSLVTSILSLIGLLFLFVMLSLTFCFEFVVNVFECIENTLLSVLPKPHFCWRFVQQIRNIEGLQAVIGVLGIASGATSVLLSVKEKKIKGVLMSDILKFYFPFYLWFIIYNCIFVILGQYFCIVKLPYSAVLCFFGAFTCAIYIFVLCFFLVISENKLHWLVMLYINKKITVFIISRKNQDSGDVDDCRVNFIGNAGEYLSNQLKCFNAPFCVRSKQLDSQVEALLSLTCEKNTFIQKGFLDDFPEIFNAQKEVDISFFKTNPNLLYDAVYFRLPCIKESYDFFCKQIEMFYNIFNSILHPMLGSGYEVESICRMFYIYTIKDHYKGYKNITAFACGLILYLYRYYSNAELPRSTSKISHISNCIYEMERKFFEAKKHTEGTLAKNIDRLLYVCKEMLVELLVMATVEQYYGTESKIYNDLYDVINRMCMSENTSRTITNLVEEDFVRYLCYADIILSQVPSNVVMADRRTIIQKIYLKNYVISKISNQYQSREFVRRV